MNTFLQGSLIITNLLISLFVLVFACMFLHSTKSVEGRKPWLFLLFAVVIFFVMQVVTAIWFFTGLDTTQFTYVFNSMFIAILLFTFIFQYNLILNSELITIVRKHKKKK
jgi:hypothetical protein